MIKVFTSRCFEKYPRRFLRIFFLLAASIICLAAAGCKSELPKVGAGDEPLRSASDGNWEYNVYNNYIGLVDYTGSEEVERLILPEKLEDLPVARLERNFLADRVFDFHEVVLPDTIVRICDGAFSGSDPWLETINIPKNVSHIGSYAFDGSHWLDSQTDEFVIVGSGVLVAYNGSGGNVVLPSRVRSVGTAFVSNAMLESVRINRGCRELVSAAFAHSSVRIVWLPDSIERIGSDCFRGNQLESVRLPGGSCEIGKYAFQGASGLVLTVQNDSDALLYAVENDIPFVIENSDGGPYRSDYLEAAGAGDVVFIKSGKPLIYNVEESSISSDRSGCVIFFDDDGDAIIDAFEYANLRTHRVIDRVGLGEDELLGVVAGYRPEMDLSGCSVSAGIDPIGWKDGSFRFDCRLSITRDGKEISKIAMTLSYLPGSGYVSASGMNIRDSLPDYLSGYTEAARSSDGSAILYARPNDAGETDDPLIIKWTFGTISFTPEKISLSIDPRLETADLNGDGINDLILYYSDLLKLTSDGQAGFTERVQVFYGPTGAKSSSADPLADFREKVTVTRNSGGGWTLSSEFGDYIYTADKSYDELYIGRYTVCRIIENRIAASISFGHPLRPTDTHAILIYKSSGNEMKLESIFFMSENDLKAASDGDIALWRIGERKFMLTGDGLYGEFETDNLCVTDPDSDYRPRIEYGDFDSDGKRDAAVIFTSDHDDNHRTEELRVVTSGGKIYKVDAPADAKGLFTVEQTDGGWRFSSKFGSFDVASAKVSGDEEQSDIEPDLTRDFRYRADGDSIVCELSILCGGSEEIFSGTSLRLIYRLDGIFKVKEAETLSVDSPELTTDFSSMMRLFSGIEHEGKKRSDLVVKLVDRGSPTLRIGFDEEGTPYLVSIKAKGQLLVPESPMRMVGNLSFNIYEAGDYLVVEQLYYDFGNTYIFYDGGIFGNHSEYGQTGDSYLSFVGGEDGLSYIRHSMRYNSVDMGQYGIFAVINRITSREDFYDESGTAVIEDGELVLTPDRSRTISDVIDLDGEFANHRGSFDSFDSIDAAIAHNIRELTSAEVSRFEMSLTFTEFLAEVEKLSGRSGILVATITDAKNAVLKVEAIDSSASLTKIEAYGQTLELKAPLPLSNGGSVSLLADTHKTIVSLVYPDRGTEKYIFSENGIEQTVDTE